MEIQRISEEDVFTGRGGKGIVKPLVDAAVAEPGDWFQVTHKSAQFVGRLRAFGLEARSRKNEEGTASVVQFRFPVGGTLLTPKPQVRKPKVEGAAKGKAKTKK